VQVLSQRIDFIGLQVRSRFIFFPGFSPAFFLMAGGDKSTKFICGERSSTGDAAVD